MTLKSKLTYLFPPYNLSSHDKNEVHALITHLASLLIGSFAHQWLYHFFSSAIRMTGWKDSRDSWIDSKLPRRLTAVTISRKSLKNLSTGSQYVFFITISCLDQHAWHIRQEQHHRVSTNWLPLPFDSGPNVSRRFISLISFALQRLCKSKQQETGRFILMIFIISWQNWAISPGKNLLCFFVFCTVHFVLQK